MTVPPLQKLAARMQRGLKHEQAVPLHTISTAATAALTAVALAPLRSTAPYTRRAVRLGRRSERDGEQRDRVIDQRSL